jgi:hypothetical protein
VGDDVLIDSDTLLVTDFMNLSRLSLLEVLIEVRCACVFIEVSARTCMSIYVCTVFLKEKKK